MAVDKERSDMDVLAWVVFAAVAAFNYEPVEDEEEEEEVDEDEILDKEIDYCTKFADQMMAELDSRFNKGPVRKRRRRE